ncbi:hypothetical protein [Bergeyella sp. RCAD1439]|uniref:hypothetical protein n=1 Tax=Bergeyella anatis TaxID=3113737 RepID=UPI002E197C89|nr:hypothetical protein [Bergeyella sp. RCAD1439]
MKLLAELPKTEEYAIEGTNDHLNLGVIYEQFQIAGMPYWITKDPVIVGLSSKRDDVYYELTPEEVDGIIKANKLAPAEELKSLSFMDKHLGVLVILGIIVVLFVYNIVTAKKEEEQPSQDA